MPLSDQHWMQQALFEAQKALDKREVPIGAVIVSDQKIIARAHNLIECLSDATAHAEMQALTAASHHIGGKYLKGCTLYVTLEPCVMCAGALYWTQIDRVVFGASDMKRGAGRFENIYHPKTKITAHILSQESELLLNHFFTSIR